MSDKPALADEIRETLNRHSRENASNTPDFILATYLIECLVAFEHATMQRDDWYGDRKEPGR